MPHIRTVMPGPDRASRRHPHLPPPQRRGKRLKMDERHRLELLHLQRTDRIRQTSRLPLPSSNKNFPGKRIRTDYSDNDPDGEENFYLLRKTLCVAVLSENFFMDSHSDLEYLQSRAGKQAIIDTHVEGIIEYLNQ